MFSLPLASCREIVPLFWVTLLAITGSGLFFLVRADGKRASAQASSREPAIPSLDVSREIQIISNMIRAYIGETHAYSSRLNTMNEQLAKPMASTDLKFLIERLIDENKQLAHVSRDLEHRLNDSQSKINILTNNLHIAHEEGRHDALTQLYGRKYFDEVFPKLIVSARDIKRALCLLLIDVDAFKHINDTHGHRNGDEVLKGVGALIGGSIRKSDVAVRYGGDEFAIIMPGSSIEDALRVAERIRSLLRIKKWRFDGQAATGMITISIGIASLSSGDSVQELFERADANLYKAKASGKNRVVSR